MMNSRFQMRDNLSSQIKFHRNSANTIWSELPKCLVQKYGTWYQLISKIVQS